MNLSPRQLLAWIAGLEVISAPIIIFIFNAIMIGYFKAKEQHQSKMIGAFGKTVEAMGKDLTKKITENLPINKEDNEHVDQADS